MDTQGYTLLDVLHVKADDLAYLYREFRPFLGKCRFRDVCMRRNRTVPSGTPSHAAISRKNGICPISIC